LAAIERLRTTLGQSPPRPAQPPASGLGCHQDHPGVGDVVIRRDDRCRGCPPFGAAFQPV